MKTITFLNNRSRVGKTTMVYNIAWMLSQMSINTLVVDLDPQCNLTALFLDQKKQAALFDNQYFNKSIGNALSSLAPDLNELDIHIENINDYLNLIPGDINLAALEDSFNIAWQNCLNGEQKAFQYTSKINNIIKNVGKKYSAQAILIDSGSNLSSLNRTIAIASEYIITPITTEKLSLEGIKNLGIILNNWKLQWQQRLQLIPSENKLNIPYIIPKILGYILMHFNAKESSRFNPNNRWDILIPKLYNKYILEQANNQPITIQNDPNCIDILKYYKSLELMAKEVQKPFFLLKPSDGAIGSHVYAVQQSFADYHKLTQAILNKVEL